MADITLEQAQTKVSELMTSISKLSQTGISSYSIGDATYTRQDLPTLREELHHWRGICRDLTTQNAAAAGDFARNMPSVAIVRVR